MAQIRPADRAGAGDSKFTPALAKASAGRLLVRLARIPSCCGNLRGAMSTLVSGLVSFIVATGILFQPIHRPLRAVGVFYFHYHTARIWVAIVGQRSFAAKASTQRHDILASSERVQSIGPALLKLKV